ncbi:MAG: ATP-binding protein [Treponema sp.]|nr:ATP-binding protein [Treponema sp.]
MALTEKGYKPRIVDKKLGNLISEFGAVLVEGPKWCGKTWTALNHAGSVVFIADPAGNFRNRETALLDPSLVLEGEPPLLIDEWQEVPGLWDAVRFSVDRRRKKGLYILTGSSMPGRHTYVHSGAGRIARLRMRTMSLFESGDSLGTVSLAHLFTGKDIDPQKSSMTLNKIINLTIKGGWPVFAGKKKYSLDIPRQYLERIADSEVSYAGGSRRDGSKITAVIRSLARNNATLVSTKTIQKDIDAEGDRVTADRNTVSLYLELLKSLYVLEEIPGWDPALRSTKKLRVSPKRLLTDPSLAAAAIGATADRLKKDLNTFGFLFEGLCIRDILVYGELNGAAVYHYRDEAGLEADVILELPNGRWGALEIKLGAHQTDAAAAGLLKLKAKMKKAGLDPPAFLAVISGLAGFACRRDDGVYVVPIDCLGA